MGQLIKEESLKEYMYDFESSFRIIYKEGYPKYLSQGESTDYEKMLKEYVPVRDAEIQ